MKRILIALMVAAAFCSTLFAQQQKTIYKDSIGSSKITVTKTSSHSPKVSDHKKTSDVLADSVAMVESEELSSDTLCNDSDSSTSIGMCDSDFPFNDKDFGNIVGSGVLITLVSIIMVFGFPIFIIFIVFFFRYKNRKARYRLAEQALAAGQTLPENFIKEVKTYDSRSQGIKNTFTGIGLFIFLWAITGNFGIGTIGLMVMFIGLGQWFIGTTSNKGNIGDKEDKAGKADKGIEVDRGIRGDRENTEYKDNSEK